MELVIVEPLVLAEEVPPLKRALKYDIKITSTLAPSSGADDVLPPPLPREDPDHGRRRRRRQAPATPQSATRGSGVRDGAPRVSVHRRLGSGPVSGSHVADGVEPFDGSQAPVPDATQLPSIPSTASIQSDPIDDMAAVVIVPRHGEENAIPEMPGLSFWLSTDGPIFTKPLAIASDKTGSVGSFLAQTPGSSSAFSPARRTEDIPSRPKAAAPDRLGLISNPPRDADGGLFPSPSPDDIPILDPVLTALCASPMGTAIRNGVDTAPLPKPHLACMVAMAKPVDVAVAAVTPHRTPIHGPGGVDVMAVTPSTGARLFPAGKDLTQVSLDDGNESSKLILGGPVSKLLQSVPQHTSPEPQVMTQPLPPVLLAPPLRGRTPPPLQVYSRRRSSRRVATMEGEAVASTSPSQPLGPPFHYEDGKDS
ncbi:unnamed protein product [Miscanthus lutarioriparius]|uniref:Uncharacterized protein n=1 Tax=Miscanthus lutarioriparius TaxID=422564 RepID=A0A811Q6K1_9POAL|nr:unnamed protein product [Miscanthus lutarioriparius]